MADTKGSALAAQATPDNADVFPHIDVSDTTMGVGGTNKIVTWANVKATLKTYFDTLYAAISHTHAESDVTNLVTDLAGKQPLDSDLTTIAGLTATTDNFIQSKGSAWASRTIAQVKADLGLTGTNSGDQTSIVGITGTTAQFNTANTDGDFATQAGTETLTGKRVTPRTGTTASSGTPTINTDNVDFYSITALAAAITSFTTNLSGTPTDGQKLWISITDNGTARAIAWGASFEASTVALPTTTVISTRLDIGFVWNAATSKWRCVAVA